MNLGGIGAFSGGLAGGYLAGSEQANRNALTNIAKGRDERSVKSAKQVGDLLRQRTSGLGQQLRQFGHHDLANIIDPQGAQNPNAPDMSKQDMPDQYMQTDRAAPVQATAPAQPQGMTLSPWMGEGDS